MTFNSSRSHWLAVCLLAALAFGCNMSGGFPSDPGAAADDGTGMLKSFLKQIVDTRTPMPEMFGAEPAFESAMRGSPQKIEPLRPLYFKLKSAGSDTQRRKVAEEMLQKLGETSPG